MELIAWHRAGEAMTADGGPLFDAKARAVAARGDWHLWVNTYAIVNKAGSMLSGGRGDELARLADFPAETYGFWVDRGATIIHTDEPALAIEWLTANGFRVPYATSSEHRSPTPTASTDAEIFVRPSSLEGRTLCTNKKAARGGLLIAECVSKA